VCVCAVCACVPTCACVCAGGGYVSRRGCGYIDIIEITNIIINANPLLPTHLPRPLNIVSKSPVGICACVCARVCVCVCVCVCVRIMARL
jgi:hypothetical protein